MLARLRRMLANAIWVPCVGCGLLTSTPDGQEIDAAGRAHDAGPDAESEELDATDDHATDGDATDDDVATDDGSAPTIVVTGRVIGTNGQGAAGWRVAWGTTSTVTDADGGFTFTGVTAPYDVSFLYPGVQGTGLLPAIWTYRGLTRSDPTLQPDLSVGSLRRDLAIRAVNLAAPVAADGGRVPVLVEASFGSPGEVIVVGVSGDVGTSVPVRWSGASEITGTLHGLAWIERGLTGPSGRTLDNEYLAYREQTLVVDADGGPFGGAVQVDLDLSPNQVPSAAFSAELHSAWADPSAGTPSVSALVAFQTGAYMDVAQEEGRSAGLLSAKMPILPRSEVVFRGTQQGSAGAFSCVHGRATPDARVVLNIPAPAVLAMPENGEGAVDSTTRFQWIGPQTVSVLTLECGGSNVWFHSVGLANEAHLPSVPALGLSPPRGSQCSWHVDVHGAFASIDEAAGPEGMIDPCVDVGHLERGSFLRDGSTTTSVSRDFRTAP